MNIRINRVLRAIAACTGPLIITIGQFFQLRDMIYYPIILLAGTILLFIIYFKKTPEYYIKEKDDGILITGSKQGMYDPDYVSYKDIIGVEKRGYNIALSLKSKADIEIYLPAKYRDTFINFIKEKIEK